MIKGVSRHVIEIRQPESVYFERAVLYLRPGAGKLPLHDIHREVESVIGKIPEKQGNWRIRGWAWFVLGALCAGSAAWIAGWLGLI